MTAPQGSNHLVVFDLRKVTVELPHSVEVLWGLEAHQLVAVFGNLGCSLRRRDRHRADQASRLALTQCVERSDHRGARCKAVVHHDHDTTGGLDAGPAARVQSAPLAYDVELMLLFLL